MEEHRTTCRAEVRRMETGTQTGNGRRRRACTAESKWRQIQVGQLQHMRAECCVQENVQERD